MLPVHKMKLAGVSSLVILMTCPVVRATTAAQASKPANPLDACNAVWDSPSKDSSGSMPIGNGDIGLNAWVEANGDLLLLISKTDAWDEKCCLCKIGRVRVKCDPLLAVTRGFRQELRLREGTIEIAGGEGETARTLRVWVDANHPVIHAVSFCQLINAGHVLQRSIGQAF